MASLSAETRRLPCQVLAMTSGSRASILRNGFSLFQCRVAMSRWIFARVVPAPKCFAMPSSASDGTAAKSSRCGRTDARSADRRAQHVCDENLVLLPSQAERPPPSDTATTPGPLCFTASADHPTRKLALWPGTPVRVHVGAHRPCPDLLCARAPSGVCVLDSIV